MRKRHNKNPSSCETPKPYNPHPTLIVARLVSKTAQRKAKKHGLPFLFAFETEIQSEVENAMTMMNFGCRDYYLFHAKLKICV